MGQRKSRQERPVEPPPGYDPAVDGPLQQLVVRSDLVSAKEPEAAILAAVDSCGFSEETIFAIKLSLEEAMTNAVRHGNRLDADKLIHVRFAVSHRRVIISIADEGPGFAPEEVPDPTSPENLERPNGRGIMLIRAYMSQVLYNPSGNEVCMVKENERCQS